MIQSESIRNPIYRDASSRLLKNAEKNEERNLCQPAKCVYTYSVLFTRNSFHDNCGNRRVTPGNERSLVYLHMDAIPRLPPPCPAPLRARYLNFCRARTGNITFAAGMEQGEEGEGEISRK